MYTEYESKIETRQVLPLGLYKIYSVNFTKDSVISKERYNLGSLSKIVSVSADAKTRESQLKDGVLSIVGDSDVKIIYLDTSGEIKSVDLSDPFKIDLSVGNLAYFGQELLKCDFENMFSYTLEGEAVMLKKASCYAIYQNKTLEIVNQYFNPYDAAITAANVSIITPEEARAMQKAEEEAEQDEQPPEEELPEETIPETELPEVTPPWEDDNIWDENDPWEGDDPWSDDWWTEEAPPAEEPPTEEPPTEEPPADAPPAEEPPAEEPPAEEPPAEEPPTEVPEETDDPLTEVN